ncbi:pentapeptide repeat-containing protein [Saccharopolyspora taberi]|uniref:Pentapeptide repeat-containing protein n=1 Tax=Saccharopolyspora taberi TaxID=60895 RepID=A0ABN3VL64_9PSEU
MGERKLGLAVTIALAVAALVGVSAALLLLDPRTTGADALRTGGLAGGSVIALYALWLNDRRRRVDEQRQAVETERQQLENRRTDLDRDRVSDERFARAVELLGHEADQVRVGALHALAGLARSNPAYTQTVLDVLCSYLRRPFLHPRYGDAPTKSEEWTGPAANNAERKLQVRLTAQRIIADLLPKVGDSGATHYDLDLTGATLEYFDLADRVIGTLVLRYSRLYSSTNLSRCVFTGPAWFTGMTTGSARLRGRFRCSETEFQDRAWFSRVHLHDRAEFIGTVFGGRSKFADSTMDGPVSVRDCAFVEDANFDAVRFNHNVDFGGTTWRGRVSADGIAFSPHRKLNLPADWAREPSGSA